MPWLSLSALAASPQLLPSAHLVGVRSDPVESGKDEERPRSDRIAIMSTPESSIFGIAFRISLHSAVANAIAGPRNFEHRHVGAGGTNRSRNLRLFRIPYRRRMNLCSAFLNFRDSTMPFAHVESG